MNLSLTSQKTASIWADVGAVGCLLCRLVMGVIMAAGRMLSGVYPLGADKPPYFRSSPSLPAAAPWQGLFLAGWHGCNQGVVIEVTTPAESQSLRGSLATGDQPPHRCQRQQHQLFPLWNGLQVAIHEIKIPMFALFPFRDEIKSIDYPHWSQGSGDLIIWPDISNNNNKDWNYKHGLPSIP